MSDLIKRVSPNYIQELAKKDYSDEYKYLSPVNLKLECMTKIELPELKWIHMDSEPQKTKIANTGQTVIVSGTWQKNRPRITGGPLLTTYAFSQLHYHWGSDDTYGSEHSYNDKKVPLEMHAVFLKENCRKQEEALAEKDGAVVISYAYKLDDEPNPGIKLVCDELPYIPNPSQLIELEEPVNLATFVSPFHNDYFVYWGSVRTNACKHVLLWILCRQPFAVNEKQLETFRQLFTSGHQPIMHNSRHTHYQGYEVFHVNPSAYSEDVLYKKTENNTSKKVVTVQKLKEVKSRRKRPSRYMRGKNCNSSVSSIEASSESVNKSVSSRSKISRNYSSSQDYLDDEKNSRLEESLGESSHNCGLVKSPEKNKDSISVKGKNQPSKRQSYYTKFFSLKDKGKKQPSKTSVQIKKSNVSQTIAKVDSNTRDMEDEKKTEQSSRTSNPVKINSNLTVMNVDVDNSVRNKEPESQEKKSKQKRKESKILKHLQSELEEEKSKLTSEYCTSKPGNEIEDFGEGYQRLAELNLNLKNKHDKSSKNSYGNWENYKNIKIDSSKEVSCSKNKKIENEVHCYRVTSELKNNIKIEGENSVNNENDLAVMSSLIDDDTIIDNEIYKDCSDRSDHIISESNSNMVSNTTNKTQQDVGINTMSLNELIFSMNLNKIYQCKNMDHPEDIKSTVTDFSESSNNVTFSSKNEIIDENRKILSVASCIKNGFNDNDDKDYELRQARSKQKSHYTSSSMSQHSSKSSKKSTNTGKSETVGLQTKYSYSNDKNSSTCSSTVPSENEQSDVSQTNIKVGHISRKRVKHSGCTNLEHPYLSKKGHNIQTSKKNTSTTSNYKPRKDYETSSVSTNRSVDTSSPVSEAKSQTSKNSKKTSAANSSSNESKRSKSSHFCIGECKKEFNKQQIHNTGTSLSDTKTIFKKDDKQQYEQLPVSTKSQSAMQSNYCPSKKSSEVKHTSRSVTPKSDKNNDVHSIREESVSNSNRSLSNLRSSSKSPANNAKTISKISPKKSEQETKFITCKDSLHLLKESVASKIPCLKSVSPKKHDYLSNPKSKVRPQTVITPIRQTSILCKLRPKTTASCISNETKCIRGTSRTNITVNNTECSKTDKLKDNLCKSTKVVNCSKLPIRSKTNTPLPLRAWRY